MKHLVLPAALLLALPAGCGAPAEQATVPPPAKAASAGSTQAAPATPAPAVSKAAPTVKAAGPAAADQPRLAVDGDGLRWFLAQSGSARALPFGAAQADVLASLERVRGAAAEGTNRDCGAGPVHYADWADGLSLVFQDGRFAGWGLDGRAAGVIATANGIGPGTTRAVLDRSGSVVRVRQTSLGTEFSTGAIHGVLDGAGPNARITDLWAGVSCVAR